MSQDNVLKCCNYEFCGNDKVPGMGSDYCMNCGSWFKIIGFGWDKLTIIDTTEECAVCKIHSGRKLMFPTNCGHSFCICCSRKILFFDESRYHLSQVPYGCPPCPNGCENPEKGKQCNCEEYDSIQEAWEQSNPNEFHRWNDEQEKSINTSSDESIYGKGICPLCRKKYVRVT